MQYQAHHGDYQDQEFGTRHWVMSRRLFAFAIGATAVLVVAGANAAEAPGMLRVTLDKAEVIRLDDPASVVLVANPQIADVVVKRNRLLFILGKRPGETRLYVYGSSGEKVIERDLIVVPAGQRAITVTRDTQTTTYSCDTRCVATGGREPASAAMASPTSAPLTAAR